MSQLLLRISSSFLVVLACACSDSSSSPPPGQPPLPELKNPSPTIASLSPASVTAGAVPFQLTITGAHFMSSSTVSWNGVPRQAGFVDSTTIHVDVPRADVAAPGTAVVTVANPTPGGGSSNTAVFTINPVAPTVFDVTPKTAVAGAGDVVIAVIGSDFRPSSVVRWNGAQRPTTYVATNVVKTTISAADLATPSTASVSVLDVASGLQSDGAIPFTVTRLPQPKLASFSPPNGVVGTGELTVTLNGTDFTRDMVVELDGVPRQTSFMDAKTVTTVLSSKDLRSAAAWAMDVYNPVENQRSDTAYFVVSLTATPGPIAIPATLWRPPAGAVPASGNYLYTESDSGDFIGGGHIALVTTPWTVGSSVLPAATSLRFSTNDWTATFSSMAGVPQFVPGYYSNIFGDVWRPGVGALWITSGSRGCAPVSGWFAVDTVVYTGGNLTSFTARFEQHCTTVTPALRGILRWTK